jgi:hypothetical protein
MERDRETEGQRDWERDRETERQRDRETERQRDRETERQRDRERERDRDPFRRRCAAGTVAPHPARLPGPTARRRPGRQTGSRASRCGTCCRPARPTRPGPRPGSNTGWCSGPRLSRSPSDSDRLGVPGWCRPSSRAGLGRAGLGRAGPQPGRASGAQRWAASGKQTREEGPGGEERKRERGRERESPE